MRGLAKGMEGSLQLTCEPGREGEVDQQIQSGVADRRTTHEGLGEQPWGPGVVKAGWGGWGRCGWPLLIKKS